MQRLVPASAAEWDRLATPETQAMLRIQNGVLQHLRRSLSHAGFMEALAPIMGPVTDPGTRGAKQASIDHYGRRYKLMSSAILYKQLMLHGTDKVFMMAPCIRMEPQETATTGRHLTEFYQCDLEIRGGSMDDAIATAEGLVRDVVTGLRRTHGVDLEFVGAPHWDVAEPFLRMTYDEVLVALAELGFDIEYGTEIPWAAEQALSASIERPLFITRYPRGARGFYDKEDPEEPGILLDFDLIYPGGYGEAISGAERESDAGRVIGRIREAGEDVHKYGWYLQMLAAGCPSSSGFGIGVERLTRFVCGLDSVTDARPFPKVAGGEGP